MALTERERRELLEDAHSDERRKEFARLEMRHSLSPAEHVAFLTWASQFLVERPADRPPMKGENFRM